MRTGGRHAGGIPCVARDAGVAAPGASLRFAHIYPSAPAPRVPGALFRLLIPTFFSSCQTPWMGISSGNACPEGPLAPKTDVFGLKGGASGRKSSENRRFIDPMAPDFQRFRWKIPAHQEMPWEFLAEARRCGTGRACHRATSIMSSSSQGLCTLIQAVSACKCFSVVPSRSRKEN